jgi:DNA-binding transcriptional regulator GbsR (MarR family)
MQDVNLYKNGGPMKNLEIRKALAMTRYNLVAALNELKKIEDYFDDGREKEEDEEGETSKGFKDIFEKLNGGSFEEVVANAANLLIKALNITNKKDDE